MLLVLSVAILCVSVPMAITSVWALVCNRRVLKKRLHLIARIHGYGRLNWRELNVDFDGVSYDRHLWQLMTFRDPMVIYPASLRELWD